MNKKGQIYIFAAVIIAVILFGLTFTYNKLEQGRLSKDFSGLSSNYDLESARFLNALIESTIIDKQSRFLGFSAEFSSYAKAKNPGYELFYVYAENAGTGSIVYIGNFLSKTIKARKLDGSELLSVDGCYSKLTADITFSGLTVPSSQYSGSLTNCIKSRPVSDSKIDICIEEEINSEICYNIDLTAGRPQVMIFTGASELEQRQVYIGGKGFIKGEKRNK